MAIDMCLACGKKLKKSEVSVQCTVCGLWCHKECSGISNDFLRCLEEAKKNTGVAYWACRPCTVYAQGMNHRMKEIERRLDAVEDTGKKNTEDIVRVEKNMDKLKEKLEKKAAKGEEAMYEELREREAKRLNVVIHGMTEPEGNERNGEKRMEWDKKGVEEIFKILELNLTIEDIKFCRRVGEKGQSPRAMIVGFYTEYARSILLRYAKHLADTEYEDVSVMPDLTRRQRQEESSMQEEADRRNEEDLTEEDVSKNLCWKVVGQRGEKRLIKGYNREGNSMRGRGRGTRTTRAGRASRGQRGRVMRNRGGTDRGKRLRNSSESDQEQNPPRRQRGENVRGTVLRGSVATGSNRENIGARVRTQDEEMETTGVEMERVQEESAYENEDELPTPSQLNAMAPPAQQGEA
jgi:hypothetical protein